jgi:hypothetical protein
MFYWVLAGFSMSRNHKDKYENTNPRRSHTIMSSEDAAAGKRSHWPELEITGKEECIHLLCLKATNFMIISPVDWTVKRHTVLSSLLQSRL